MPAAFAAQIRALGADARRRGFSVRDMSAGGSLELSYTGGKPDDGDSARLDDASPLTWLEPDPQRSRDVTKRLKASPFRYFLDATQRSLPCYYVGSIPIVCGFVSAGILERAPSGEARLMPGMHVFEQFLIAPVQSGRFEVDYVLDQLSADGARIFDPLVALMDDRDRYRASLDDFGQLMNASYDAVGRRREEIEIMLLERWLAGSRDGILVVDGPLRRETTNAIGVVKSFTRQYLSGPEASALFNLGMNQRSALFQLEKSRSRPAVDAWYQRFWESTGRDPRHALVRIETSSANPAGRVEDLAGWLMEERAPRATNDARWPTLLYPIHYLEQILKKQLDGATRGWPGI